MTSPQRRRPDSPRPAARLTRAERKRQLLAHAKHLFVTLGYHATTTEKIAAAAGVTEPILYRHFDSKKALFLEVLEEVRSATLRRWHAETAGLTDPLAKLHAIMDSYLGSTRLHAVEFHIMHRALVETDDEGVLLRVEGGGGRRPALARTRGARRQGAACQNGQTPDQRGGEDPGQEQRPDRGRCPRSRALTRVAQPP